MRAASTHGMSQIDREFSFAPGDTEAFGDEAAFDAFIRIAAQSALPILALISVMAAGYLYRDVPLALVDDQIPGTGAWLSLGALAFPASLFVVHLTNRRYGPTIAFVQVGVTWTFIALCAFGPALGIAWNIPYLADFSPVTIVAFCASAAFAQAASVVAFHEYRGGTWWRAPFYGTVWASAAFAATYFTAAEFGPETTWLEHMGVFFAMCLGANVVLLILYKWLRPLILPLPGGDY